MNFTRNNSKYKSNHDKSNHDNNKPYWSKNSNSNCKLNKVRKNTNNHNIFTSTGLQKPHVTDVNSLVAFPELSKKKKIHKTLSHGKTAFLEKLKHDKSNVKPLIPEKNLDLISNLPRGWVRLSATNPSSPTKEEIEWQKKQDEFERKKKLVCDIWSSLRIIQKKRNELNEVLGSNSPYYDCYDILGPPGESDNEYEDEDEDEDEDYNSTSDKSEDDYQ